MTYHGWKLEFRIGPSGNYSPVLTDPSGWRADYPIRYSHNGEVVYDNPERIPTRVRRWVSRMLAPIWTNYSNGPMEDRHYGWHASLKAAWRCARKGDSIHWLARHGDHARSYFLGYKFRGDYKAIADALAYYLDRDGIAA